MSHSTPLSVQSGQIAGRVVVVRHASLPRYASATAAAAACVWALGAMVKGASVHFGQPTKEKSE